MRFTNVKPEIDDAVSQRRRIEAWEDDYRGVLIVASAWLLFYVVALTGSVLYQGAAIVASLH